MQGFVLRRCFVVRGNFSWPSLGTEQYLVSQTDVVYVFSSSYFKKIILYESLKLNNKRTAVRRQYAIYDV